MGAHERRVSRNRIAAAAAAAAAATLIAACGGGEDATSVPAKAGLAEQNAAVGESGRNVFRVPGISPADVAGAAVLAAYPPGGKARPHGWVLPRLDSWRLLALAAQFAAAPIDAAIMPLNKDFLPTATVDLLVRRTVDGFPKGKGLQVLLLGNVGDDVLLDLQEQELKFTRLAAPGPARLAADVVPYRGGWAADFSPNVVVVSSEARDYALIAAAWSAFSGDSLAFVSRDGVPPETAKLLSQRQKLKLAKPNIYVVGPPKVVSEQAVARLRAYGPVKRVAGKTVAETSVAFARYHDRATGFGWGISRGPANFTLMNAHQWGNVAAAFTFSARQAAPLLLTDNARRLPPALGRYLARLTRRRASQGFVLGDENSISSEVLRHLDRILGG